MNDAVHAFIKEQIPDRQKILAKIHDLIMHADDTVEPEVETIKRREMIVYKSGDAMKYGLASVKNYMSLYIIPMYGSVELHSKYKLLLHKANFQKACINFQSKDELPLAVVEELLEDCADAPLTEEQLNYLH